MRRIYQERRLCVNPKADRSSPRIGLASTSFVSCGLAGVTWKAEEQGEGRAGVRFAQTYVRFSSRFPAL